MGELAAVLPPPVLLAVASQGRGSRFLSRSLSRSLPLPLSPPLPLPVSTPGKKVPNHMGELAAVLPPEPQTLIVSERRGNNSKRVKDFFLQANALTVLCVPHFLDSGPQLLNLDSCTVDSPEPVTQPEVREGNSDGVTPDLDGISVPTRCISCFTTHFRSLTTRR